MSVVVCVAVCVAVSVAVRVAVCVAVYVAVCVAVCCSVCCIVCALEPGDEGKSSSAMEICKRNLKKRRPRDVQNHKKPAQTPVKDTHKRDLPTIPVKEAYKRVPQKK